MKKKEMKENGLVTENSNSNDGSRKSLRKCNKGLSTVEYIILLILIAVGGIGIWSQFGETVVTRTTQADDAVMNM